MPEFPVFGIKSYTNILPIQLLRKTIHHINNYDIPILRSEI